MNISSSVSQLSTSSVSVNPNGPIKKSVRSAEPVVAPKIEKEQSSNKQTSSNIVIDEKAIALFEKNQVEQSQFEQNQVSLSTQSQSSNASFSSENQDQPSAKNETAVANYQAIDNLAQRESVQKLFGVDLFA